MSIQTEIDRIAGAKTTLGNYLQQNGVAVPSGATLDEMALQLADVIEKQNKITAAGILKGDGAGGVSTAVPGTDYMDIFSVIFTGNMSAYACNRTADEIYAAYKASLQPGGKQLVAYTPDGVLGNVRMLVDAGTDWFWLQFSSAACSTNDFTTNPVPSFKYVDVTKSGNNGEFSGGTHHGQSAIHLGSNGAIPKVDNSLGLADEFVAATPDTDYMTPSMGTSGAKVGQTLNVQAVDASGKPTKWETRDALPVPKTYPVTLTVAGWNSSTKQQAVSFAAASSTETDHLLIPTPKLSDLTAYNDAGILCIGEDGANQTLTFQCETVPTAAITVYVTVQSVNYQGDAS